MSLTRRDFTGSLAAASAVLGLQGCSDSAAMTYDEAVTDSFAHTKDFDLTGPAAQREIVRYGTMAANSHNTQPWTFKLADNKITVGPDLSRGCPAVDPDHHHVFASLGCATENMVSAARAFGLNAVPASYLTADDEITLDLEAAPAVQTELFKAVPERQCTRAEYDGKPVVTEQLKSLEKMAESDAVDIIVLTGESDKKAMLDYVIEGNTVQMNDAAFVQELKDWIRFNEVQAVSTRDGLTYRSTGNPAQPEWLGKILFNVFFQVGSENEKYRKQIESSAGLAVFSCRSNDKAHWIEAGRSYQRFALASTAMGLSHAFVNQPVEVPAIRQQAATYLNLGDRLPDLIIRFGYGSPTPRNLRRPTDAVIV